MPDLKIVIAEDDQYSCDMMALLLAHDRRTQVVAEGADALHKVEMLDPAVMAADLILLDSEIPGDSDWPFTLMRGIRRQSEAIKIVCTGTTTDDTVLNNVLSANGNGYIIKDEIHFALAETLIHAAKGAWVSTPSVANLISREKSLALKPHFIVNGTLVLDSLSTQDFQIARLALLFNQPYKDIADELIISRGHVADLVSTLYDKLGLTAVLDGRVSPEVYFDDPEILGLFHTLIKKRQSNPNARAGIKTLAFHMLTLPEIVEEKT